MDSHKTGGSFGIVSTIRENPKQTKEFIDYHLNIGASHIVVCFDDPEDPVMADYRDEPRVTCIPCTQDHWNQLAGQTTKFNEEHIKNNFRYGSRLLRAMGVDFIICLDGDELLYADEPVPLLLSKVKKQFDIVKFPVLEAVQHPGMNDALALRSRCFKVPRNGRSIRHKIGCPVLHRRFNHLTKSGFFGHQAGKAFFRSTAPVDIFNHHTPRSGHQPLKVFQTGKMFLLHFDCVCFEGWEHKWRRRVFGETNFDTMSEHRFLQQKEIRRAMEDKDKRMLYKLYRRYHWWGRIKLFCGRHLRLIKKIDLPETLFGRMP